MPCFRPYELVYTMKNYIKSSNRLALIFSLLAISISSSLYAEKIYKWVDEDGNIVYSQTPPAGGGKAERITNIQPPPVDPVEAMKALRERTEAFKQRREDRMLVAEEGEQALEQKKHQEKLCARLKKNLQTLQNNPRIRQNAKGKEPVVMTEEKRLEQIKSTKARIQKECTNS